MNRAVKSRAGLTGLAIVAMLGFAGAGCGDDDEGDAGGAPRLRPRSRASW